MHIGILGTGKMGSTLGRLLAARGHSVILGSRAPKAKQESFTDVVDGVKARLFAAAGKWWFETASALPEVHPSDTATS